MAGSIPAYPIMNNKEKLSPFIGKTIASIIGGEDYEDQAVEIQFTDGTKLYLDGGTADGNEGLFINVSC